MIRRLQRVDVEGARLVGQGMIFEWLIVCAKVEDSMLSCGSQTPILSISDKMNSDPDDISGSRVGLISSDIIDAGSSTSIQDCAVFHHSVVRVDGGFFFRQGFGLRRPRST